MCGIVGVASAVPILEREWLSGARACLAHRGPDDRGEWWSADGRVGFAHTRLAIVDLSAAGAQPMADDSGQFHLIFNGEIYNFIELRQQLVTCGYRFRSHSDSEVILAAYKEWGTQCLERFNGMFSFALYDYAAQCVFLARDRAGEKPMFYKKTEKTLLFASELKSLFASPEVALRINYEALDFYLALGYVPGGSCILEGFNKLPPAHAALFDLQTGEMRLWEYWRLPSPVLSTLEPVASDDALLDELEWLLADAVRRQMVADVPVGILLSGGIDSSLVAAMAARANPDVKTFTISFPGHGSYDEGPYAKMVATHLGTDHTELQAMPATVNLLPQLARQYDEPIGDSSMVPTFLVSRLVREKCTVALGGDAGDELFGGYVYHSRMQEHLRWRRMMPRPFKALAGSAASVLPTGFRGRTTIRSLTLADNDAWMAAPLHFDRPTRRALAPATRGIEGSPPEAYRLAAGRPGESLIQKMTIADFKTYLPEDILVKVDRASMLASLEIRAPFLDFRIIEFAFGKVPDRLRATNAGRKILLRELAKRLLPEKLDLFRKQGFSLPLHTWFRGEWGAYIRNVLLDAPSRLYDERAIRSLLKEQDAGFANSQRLFNLAILELWRREYSIDLP